MTIKTINNYLDNYLSERCYTVSPSTLKSEISKVKNLSRHFGKQRVDAVTHSDIRQLMLKWHRRFKNKTINDHLTILRAIFYRAKLDGAIRRNPMEGIDSLKIDSPVPTPFTKSELAKMFACEGVCRQGKNAALFNALVGLRISELIALSWDDVDWERHLLYVRRARVLQHYKVPKTEGSVRAVELNTIALSLLKAQFALTGSRRRKTVDVLQRDNKTYRKEAIAFVFINSHNRRPYNNAKQFSKAFFDTFLQKAGVSHRGAGQLRHTFASQCLTAGISKEWIAQQMGHTGTHMIDKHYGKWLRDDAPDCAIMAANHLSDVFGKAMHTPTTAKPQVDDPASQLVSKLRHKPRLMLLIEQLVEGA